jgi:N-acylneuraminate cytidylyltransferase
MKIGKITAVIAVRKNSERVKNKNIKPFNDTNLLENKIKTLLRVKNLDDIIVSSDCEKMLSLANSLGVKTHIRDDYYASNECPGSENLKYLAQEIESDYILYTPVTSPLVKAETYEWIINKFRSFGDEFDSIITINYIKDFLWLNDKPLNYNPLNCPRSQDLKSIFKLNFGACLLSRETMIKNKYVVGDKPYWHELENKEGIDIDIPFDFNIAELVYEKNVKEKFTNKKSMILDCTIRDGGFENNFNFTEKEVKRNLKASSDIGYNYFEIGYLTDPKILTKKDGLWRNVPFKLITKIKKEINPRCKISAMIDCWRYNINDLPPSDQTDIDLIRVCSYEEQVDMALSMCKTIKSLGYEVSLNIICTSHISINSFIELRNKLISEDFLDFLCFADSYGALTPDYVKKIMTLFRNMNPNVLIGFHAHDNMSLSMANTITALENGADMVDGTYTGIGRGGGNLPLEIITLYLNISKNYNLDLNALFTYLDLTTKNEEDIERIKQAICGILNVHPYRLRDIAGKSILETYTELNNLSLKDKARYPSKWLKI